MKHRLSQFAICASLLYTSITHGEGLNSTSSRNWSIGIGFGVLQGGFVGLNLAHHSTNYRTNLSLGCGSYSNQVEFDGSCGVGLGLLRKSQFLSKKVGSSYFDRVMLGVHAHRRSDRAYDVSLPLIWSRSNKSGWVVGLAPVFEFDSDHHRDDTKLNIQVSYEF